MNAVYTHDPKFEQLAQQLADKSTELLTHYYRQVVQVDTKKDLSPVTQADRNTEAALREMIARHYPDHGIQGEEFGNENEQADYQWVIDPIDGTVSFIAGRPIFTTLIALTYHKVPVLGVINQPITKDRWLGVKGKGATLNGKKIQTSNIATLDKAMLATTSPLLFDSKTHGVFQSISEKVKHTLYGGDAYNYGLLASGSVDAIVETGLKPHDFCALSIVIEEAGGKVTDFEGNALTLASSGDVLACSSVSLHQHVLPFLK